MTTTNKKCQQCQNKNLCDLNNLSLFCKHATTGNGKTFDKTELENMLTESEPYEPDYTEFDPDESIPQQVFE